MTLNLINLNSLLKQSLKLMQEYYLIKSFNSSNSTSITIKLNKSKKKSDTKLAINTTNKLLYGPILKRSKFLKSEESKEDSLNPKSVMKKIRINNKINNKENLNLTSKINSKSSLALETIDDYTDLTIYGKKLSSFPLLNLSKKQYSLNDLNQKILSISIFEGGYSNLPSVRKILQETMPLDRKLILEKWENKMISKLGEIGFQNYRQALLDKGKIFHECIEMTLRKEDVSPEQLVGIENQWRSVREVITRFSNIKLLESRVIHPLLLYQGCVDCVGIYKNLPVIVEFKTSTKPKLTLPSTYDDPLQLAAYIGALNYDQSYSHLPNVDGALLVVAYATGLSAHVHVISKKQCLEYWNLWLRRLAQFLNEKKKLGLNIA